jgi:hypothetical protein
MAWVISLIAQKAAAALTFVLDSSRLNTGTLG